jgi:glutathione S-transferase
MGLQQDLDNPAAITARAAAAAYYKEMEQVLGEQAYLAGEFSFADIAFYMAQLFGARMGAPMRNAPHLLRWRDQMTSRPSVLATVKPMVGFLISRGRPVPADLMSAIGLQ